MNTQATRNRATRSRLEHENEHASRVEPESHPAAVDVRNLDKWYGSYQALANVSIHVNPGECLVLLGPSGCGKSTLLRTIAGLEALDSGEVRVDGTVVGSKRKHVPPAERNLGMVFQSYALWPHMSVERQITFVLRSRGMSGRESREAARLALQTVGLEHLATRRPDELSGGQQQRVALARALWSSRSLILFDEPLSNLDEALRIGLRREIRALQRRLGFSAIWVTHDRYEATSVADRIAVMKSGEICEIGEPLTMYERPRSIEGARALGRVNEIPVVTEGSVARWADTGWSFPMEHDVDAPTLAIVRPEDVEVLPAGARAGNHGEIADIEKEGRASRVWITNSSTDLTIEALYESDDLRPGDTVSVGFRRAWGL